VEQSKHLYGLPRSSHSPSRAHPRTGTERRLK